GQGQPDHHGQDDGDAEPPEGHAAPLFPGEEAESAAPVKKADFAGPPPDPPCPASLIYLVEQFPRRYPEYTQRDRRPASAHQRRRAQHPPASCRLAPRGTV